MENSGAIIGPDTNEHVIHYVYPEGRAMSEKELDPNVGGWYKNCKHIYENIGLPICPNCGKHTHEINWEETNKQNKQWLKDNPDAWREVGWWSI